jgi:Gas vesicle synthesis protein GvpL/GvpF
VYGLLDRGGPPFEASGRRIELLEIDGVFAAVEQVAERPAVSEEALRVQHEIVCLLGGRFDALLPARFGAWVEVDELRRIVGLRREAIARALDLVKGRVQMTLRIAGASAEPAGPQLERPVRTGTEYLRTRRAAARGHVPAAIADGIDAAIRDLVVSARTDEAGKHGVAIYHLIDRESVERYRSATASLTGVMPGCAIRVSGPWPPFAFVPELWS